MAEIKTPLVLLYLKKKRSFSGSNFKRYYLYQLPAVEAIVISEGDHTGTSSNSVFVARLCLCAVLWQYCAVFVQIHSLGVDVPLNPNFLEKLWLRAEKKGWGCSVTRLCGRYTCF